MANSRQQAVEAALRLFRAQGYAGTGLAQIWEESGSPKGSFYFNFPGGKHELALEALKLFGERLSHRIHEAAALHGEDPVSFVRFICARQARDLETSGWTQSCLAQQLANELAPGDEEMTTAIAAVTQTWINSMAVVMQHAAASREEATTLATAFLAALNGARSMSRTVLSKVPFESVAEMMTQMLTAASAHRRPRPAARRSPRNGKRRKLAAQ
jgi:TetR/AcrR family transcriptional repressor of lmrAB and yxaGH operons